ncbi:hypothetical protein Ancab_026378 [Ancistrocladus abbreviatus]
MLNSKFGLGMVVNPVPYAPLSGDLAFMAGLDNSRVMGPCNFPMSSQPLALGMELIQDENSICSILPAEKVISNSDCLAAQFFTPAEDSFKNEVNSSDTQLVFWKPYCHPNNCRWPWKCDMPAWQPPHKYITYSKCGVVCPESVTFDKDTLTLPPLDLRPPDPSNHLNCHAPLYPEQPSLVFWSVVSIREAFEDNGPFASSPCDDTQFLYLANGRPWIILKPLHRQGLDEYTALMLFPACPMILLLYTPLLVIRISMRPKYNASKDSYNDLAIVMDKLIFCLLLLKPFMAQTVQMILMGLAECLKVYTGI